jgi:hypothetical protein|eukprot:Transcript_8467.p1 GENE.Transcript_8467~~Transcript_8467.p1  ORF type:complete len:235 (-),score=77.28 Transcript_8467:723-1427(-)
MALSSDDDDDDTPPIVGFQPPTLAQLQQAEEDSDEEEDAAPSAAAVPTAAPTEEEEEGEEQEEESADGADPAQPGELPSAMDALLDKDDQDFLREKYTPEFDASKRFKPPPLTAADMAPAYGTERTHLGPVNVPPPKGWQGEHTFKRQDEAQHYSNEYNFGRQPGAVRMRGSICHETDDERGRRVRYGAAAMLAADPWSACNPNFAFKDSSVTRGHDRRGVEGRKRPAKEMLKR